MTGVQTCALPILENLDDGMIDAYAEWMTSSENPTFTRVIANRLWKRVFGHGVFEPVDELTEATDRKSVV